MTTGLDIPCLEPRLLGIDGPLRLPASRALRSKVRTLLLDGARCIVVDLSTVDAIDAAGVGELVRAYNMAVAADRALQVIGANGSVREILDRTGLYGLLSAHGGRASVTSSVRGDRGRNGERHLVQSCLST